MIVSSDKDFLQVVDQNIEVYSPIKKKTYGKKEVQEELGMIPENYLIMKALLGDNSDNLTGIKGLGPKTLLKEFPDLINKPGVTLKDIYSSCEQKLQTKKIFAQILYDWDKVKTNWELMNLSEPRLGDYEIVHILNRTRNSGKSITDTLTAKGILDAANVPQEGRVLLMPSSMYNGQLLANGQYKKLQLGNPRRYGFSQGWRSCHQNAWQFNRHHN